MSKKLWLCASINVLACAMAQGSIAQQIPSKPISEDTVKAGDSFSVDVVLQVSTPQYMQASANYSQTQGKDGFGCEGGVEPNKTHFVMTCSTGRKTSSGEYKSDGKISFFRRETGERSTIENRLPVVTVSANPYDATQFPTVVSTSLVLTTRQSLSDAAARAQAILDQISSHFPQNMKDTKENRAYLRAKVEDTKIVLALTRKRYETAPDRNSPPQIPVPMPVFFEDFDRRLDLILTHLGGSASRASSLEEVTAPRFVLAQMPRTTDSVTVGPQSGFLDKSFEEFVKALTDMVTGFSRMGNTGETRFSWSVATTPAGAEIWVSRLGEREQKWAGLTNLKDQKLDYAIWTFRFDWGGCSKTETPDPYLQTPIEIRQVKAGCKVR